MRSIAPVVVDVIGGVDTHQDLHTAAVVSIDGEVLATKAFSATRAGYRAMLRWFADHGNLLRVGVEATGSYGAGITRHLALAGVPVLEVTGPDPALRHARGKDDTLDAVAAAKAALTGQRVAFAKDRSGAVEALRVLRATRKPRCSPKAPSETVSVCRELADPATLTYLDQLTLLRDVGGRHPRRKRPET